MNEIGFVGRIIGVEFMIQVLNDLSEEYDAVLGKLSTCIVIIREEKLTN